MHSLRVNPSFSSVSGSPLLHPCPRMNIAVVHDANIGNLCLHLCFQLNMLIVFNQQWCCFISMFCATYSLSDNVVITRIFPTSKLGDDPSFFELPFDSTIWWNPLIFLRIISVVSGSITYPLCFIKGWWVGGGRLETACRSSEVLVCQASSRAVQKNLREEAPRLVMVWKEMAAGCSAWGLGIFCGIQQPDG